MKGFGDVIGFRHNRKSLDISDARIQFSAILGSNGNGQKRRLLLKSFSVHFCFCLVIKLICYVISLYGDKLRRTHMVFNL